MHKFKYHSTKENHLLSCFLFTISNFHPAFENWIQTLTELCSGYNNTRERNAMDLPRCVPNTSSKWNRNEQMEITETFPAKQRYADIHLLVWTKQESLVSLVDLYSGWTFQIHAFIHGNYKMLSHISYLKLISFLCDIFLLYSIIMRFVTGGINNSLNLFLSWIRINAQIWTSFN